MFFLGISGHIGCGKTSLAKRMERRLRDKKIKTTFYSLGFFLKEEVGKEFCIFPFLVHMNNAKSMMLKEISTVTGMDKAKKMFGLMPNDTYRKLLQEYAQNKRKENPNYWIEKVDEYFKDKKYDCVIFDDIRQPNEFEWVKSNGGMMIRLEEYPSYLPPVGMQHEVEHFLDNREDFDIVFFPAYGGLSSVADHLADKLVSEGVFNHDAD